MNHHESWNERNSDVAEPATILLVDDEHEIIKLMEIYFGNEGYRILTAHDGVEALEQLRKERVDLIVLDVMMPNMDGIEACMKIREEQKMPIIMLSAKSMDMDKIMGLSIGADDYVTKPFNPLELVARAKSQLRRYYQFNEGREKGNMSSPSTNWSSIPIRMKCGSMNSRFILRRASLRYSNCWPATKALCSAWSKYTNRSGKKNTWNQATR